MASKRNALVNNLNQRARDAGVSGILTVQLIDALKKHYGNHCMYPGCKASDVTVDHVDPLEKGGKNEDINLQLLCEHHNKSKKDKHADYRNGNIFHFVTELTEISEKSTNGGRRPGAGRKPYEATVLKRRIIENKIDEAEASFAFLVEIRDNDSEPSAQRLAAAESILDRVLGKPTTMQPSAGEDLYRTYAKRLKEFVIDGTRTNETSASLEGVQLGGSGLQPVAVTGPDTPVA